MPWKQFTIRKVCMNFISLLGKAKCSHPWDAWTPGKDHASTHTMRTSFGAESVRLYAWWGSPASEFGLHSFIGTYRVGHRYLKCKTINAHTLFSSIFFFPLPPVYLKVLEQTILPLRLAHRASQPTEDWAFQLTGSHPLRGKKVIDVNFLSLLFPGLPVS